MLRSHGRYDYSALPDRPDYSWPDGKRLAVHLSLNVEHFAFGEGMGNDYDSPHPQPNHRAYALRDYGNRVGAWRLLELAKAYDLPYALLVNTERSDEIVAHGRSNGERQVDMSPEEERQCIEEAATTAQHEGKRPAGWLGPYISQTGISLDLLKGAGFRYMMDWSHDDQPIWMRTDHGPILSIPYSHDFNDTIEMVTRRLSSREFCANLIDQFDEMLEESHRRPLVMPIVLHSFVLSQPYRLRQFRRVIEHILQHRDEIWLTLPQDICANIEGLTAGTVPGR
jgi:allantoinase